MSAGRFVCSMCGGELFRQGRQQATVLSCFHALCDTCSPSVQTDKLTCPVCLGLVDAGRASADSAVFRPASELLLQMRTALEALEWQQGHSGVTKPTATAVVGVQQHATHVDTVTAVKPAARLSMKKRQLEETTPPSIDVKNQAEIPVAAKFNRPKAKIKEQ